MIRYLPLKIGSNSETLKFHVLKRHSAPEIIPTVHFTSFHANRLPNSSDLLSKSIGSNSPGGLTLLKLLKFAQQIKTKTYEV